MNSYIKNIIAAIISLKFYMFIRSVDYVFNNWILFLVTRSRTGVEKIYVTYTKHQCMENFITYFTKKL
jgi:hypothetical protein